MGEPAVRVSGVSKTFRLYHERASSLKERIVNRRRAAYEEFWALKDISLEIHTSETAGLIGANGSGKTTLLKLVAGIIRPTSGRIETRGRIASLLELGAGFHPDLTGRENVYLNASILGLSRKETDKYFDQIVAFAELEPFIDMQVRHYSSGMYVRLGFAVAVHVDPEILIVDEVLAVGDEAFQRRCLGRIRDFQRDGRTIVFVTHAVDIVREICTRAFFLEKGVLVAEGRPSDVVDTFRRHIHGGDPQATGPVDERGSGEASFSDVRFIDDAGEDRQVYNPGESLEIRARLDVTCPIADPVIGVIVYDDAGRYLWGTNTGLRDMDLGTVDGPRTVRFTIPALPVLDTTCFVTLAVSSRSGQDYYWREKGWAFKVVSQGADLGSVHFDAGIEVDPA
jgi:ABC-type polysaccharide/polyol phosphate transport system ATPase subunit